MINILAPSRTAVIFLSMSSQARFALMGDLVVRTTQHVPEHCISCSPAGARRGREHAEDHREPRCRIIIS